MEYIISKKITSVVKEQYSNIAGIIIYNNGNIMLEEYFHDYTAEDLFHIASVTKSIVSALVGIAIRRKSIENIDQKILDFFPDYTIKKGEKTIQQISIRDLLTMTVPYKYKSEPYSKVYSSENWVKAALDLAGGKKNIGEFHYSTVGIQILSGILVKATGQSLLDFANRNLFKPLGIKDSHSRVLLDKDEHLAFLKDRHISGWVIDPSGFHTAGWGLALTTRDMAKVGQLYLNKGIWEGKEILSADWIEDSVKEHSKWGDFSYGYLWWIIRDQQKECFAAIGDGGNIIYVDPEEKWVIAISSWFMPRPKDRVKFIREELIPLFNR